MARRVYVFDLSPNVTLHVAARVVVLDAFGDLQTFGDYFGNYVRLGGTRPPHAYLGVANKRDASRLDRVLTEQLGEIEILHRKPPSLGKVTFVLGEGIRIGRVQLEGRIVAARAKSD
jgi:hypothetical protein